VLEPAYRDNIYFTQKLNKIKAGILLTENIGKPLTVTLTGPENFRCSLTIPAAKEYNIAEFDFPGNLPVGEYILKVGECTKVIRKLPENADVKYLVEELNQTQAQIKTDNDYQTVLTICGMPNRNGGSSTSDTGSAVIMRDGWEAAEARAKDSETIFKCSEKESLKIALKICRDMGRLNLSPSDIDARFTRRNYENIQAKAQVLTMMLQSEKIDPRLAFEHCGMFPDPELAYAMSLAYYLANQSAETVTDDSAATAS
jgi:hypothetical protein